MGNFNSESFASIENNWFGYLHLLPDAIKQVAPDWPCFNKGKAILTTLLCTVAFTSMLISLRFLIYKIIVWLLHCCHSIMWWTEIKQKFTEKSITDMSCSLLGESTNWQVQVDVNGDNWFRWSLVYRLSLKIPWFDMIGQWFFMTWDGEVWRYSMQINCVEFVSELMNRGTNCLGAGLIAVTHVTL